MATPLPAPPSKIAVGPAHSLVIGKGGQKIFAWGKNQNNVFLLDEEDADGNVINSIPLLPRITELPSLRPTEILMLNRVANKSQADGDSYVVES